MSNVIIDREKIDILANAISVKSGEAVTMTLDEMVEAVDSIETGGGELNLQAKTYNISSAGTTTVTADSGYDGLSSVAVSVPSATLDTASPYIDSSINIDVFENGTIMASYFNMPTYTPVASAGYVGTSAETSAYISLSGTYQLPTQAATTITPSTSSQTAVTAGKYTTGAVTVAAMPSGTAGTPTATKGSVSNHQVSVTPSVSNTSGYISGGTINGTAVTVTASELVSGSDTVTTNDTYDVTNLAELIVNVSGGGGGSVTQDANGYIVLPSTGGGGGGGGATQHTIYFEFTDSTDATINAWYDSSFISDAITATEPTTYGQKTVDSASLDGVEWYARPTETWETIYDDNTGFYNDPDNDYPYCWVSSLSDVTIATGSVWRVTYNNVQYRCTAKYDSIIAAVAIGNPKWAKGLDDGSDAPFVFDNPGWGAWTGSLNAPNTNALYHFKIERLVTA